MLPYLTPWNDSNKPESLLSEYLAATRAAIKDEYQFRVQMANGLPFDDFWNRQCDYLAEVALRTGFSANAIASSYGIFAHGDHAVELALQLAVLYWLDSSYAHDTLKNEVRGWAALVRCHFHLGVASGPETPEERRLRGPRTRAASFRPARDRILATLKNTENKKYKTFAEAQEALAKVIDDVMPSQTQRRARKIKPGQNELKIEVGRCNDSHRFVQERRYDDVEIEAELVRVIRRPLQRVAHKKATPR